MTTAHVIKPLTPDTFPAWLALAQKHNGVWGGCYCSYFHADTEHTVKSDYDRATFKRRLVDEGVAHAALVFDGDDAIAWCEYGSPIELPGIYHRKQYDAGETNPAPWRITCFFVDRDHRRSGVAREALDGALELIAQAGGGEVVSSPTNSRPARERHHRSFTTEPGRCSRGRDSPSSDTSASRRRLCARRLRLDRTSAPAGTLRLYTARATHQRACQGVSEKSEEH